MQKLRFHLNKELDKQMAEEFLDTKVGGIDFGQGIVRIHPALRRDSIDQYFDRYYLEHEQEILDKTKTVEQAWHEKEGEYFSVTENLFGEHRFPEGEYIAYPSIINCNPRFLDNKTFQFFYQRTVENIIYIIAHELTHFIFFDFVEKKLGREFAKLSEDSQWDLSEIFNIVVLRSDPYSNIIQRELVQPYPDHEKYMRKFEQVFKDSSGIEEFIKKGIIILNK